MSQEVAIAHHGPPSSFLRKHVFSVDHKVIGKQYFALAMCGGAWIIAGTLPE